MVYLYCLGVIIVGAVMMATLTNTSGYIFGGMLIGHAIVLASMQLGRDHRR